MSGITPSFDPDTNLLTIPRSTWATYYVNGERVKGSVVITEETIVEAKPNPPTHFREGIETEWTFTPNPTQLPAETQTAETESSE